MLFLLPRLVDKVGRMLCNRLDGNKSGLRCFTAILALIYHVAPFCAFYLRPVSALVVLQKTSRFFWLSGGLLTARYLWRFLPV